MLNDVMDQVVLVKGWKKGAYWSFPRGKINKDEKDLDCAVREVYEETGFDIKGAGLVVKEEDMKFIEVTMREQQIRLYVFKGVPVDTHFEPRTRKEISKIQWYKLSDLPTLKKLKQQHEGRGEDLATNANKFYMVAPFLGPLKKWIAQQSKHDILRGLHADHVPPTEVRGEPMMEEALAPENDIVQPIAGDMDRLLAHLRKSSQRQAPSDLLEVSGLDKSSNDTSTELKRLLSVKETPSPANTSIVQDHARKPDAARSNSLLALLRGEGTTTVTGQTQNRVLPQTPVEQITTDTALPQSPHQHHPRPPPSSNPPPPPSFVFPPSQKEQHYAQHPFGQQPQPDDTNLPVHPNPRHSSSAQHMAPLSQSSNLHMRVPAPTQPIFNGAPSHGPVIAPTSQKYQEVPAPYHRIGDPRSAPTPQFPNLHAPSIPPASKLPLPKLNSHSLALLDTFRNGKVKEPAKAQEFIPTPASPNPALNPNPTGQNRKYSVQELQVWKSLGNDHEAAATIKKNFQEMGRDPNSPLSQDPALNPDWDGRKLTKEDFELWRDVSTSPETAAKYKAIIESVNRSPVSEDKPRTQHQDALLNLFRKPSVPASEIPKSSPPASIARSTPVELSAHTSIAPSMETSRKHNASPAQQPMNSKANTSLMHGSVNGKQASQEQPVSATVTGPLDIPQFEEVPKRANNAQVRDNNGTSNGTVHSHGYRASPISIMRRPASAQIVRETALRKRDGPIAAPQRESGHRSKPSSESVHKPFQPQILRRPPQPPHQAQSNASSVAPAVMTQHRLSFDRRDSQPKEHKQALLSLFEKPARATSPKFSASPAVVSPLHAEPSQAETFCSEPARSRIGSVSSPIGDGSVRPGSGRQTPIGANDRSFLLGYLEGVAKGERR